MIVIVVNALDNGTIELVDTVRIEATVDLDNQKRPVNCNVEVHDLSQPGRFGFRRILVRWSRWG
jgi:hypothetical protein